MLRLRLTVDQIVHHENLYVSWMATLCGLRVAPDDRARLRLTQTNDPVDCMTCLVLMAREGT